MTRPPKINLPIGGVQKLSLVDYPGHPAATIFTIGCNMRCGYCHNPELVLPERFIDPIPVDDVLGFLRSRIDKLDACAITGGEPTMHDGLVDFCRELKSMGFLVKLDSNGTHPKMLRSMIEDKLIDFIAMDVKAPLDRYHEVVARPIDVDAIAESIRLIKSSDIDHEFRTTIVRSQLSPKDIESIGRLIDGAKRYAFQRFVPGKTLSPQFEFEQSYDDNEMEQMKKMMQKCVKHCVVH